ncbi:MAG: hypothetical protein MASP_00532 [Candidatus Methanolliviera sp. GoM_asphalt]|nr:MAG: hypothetical protein MASP_00532 [Candidatus Methanolliviera sp. GoM_asphalt]
MYNGKKSKVNGQSNIPKHIYKSITIAVISIQSQEMITPKINALINTIRAQNQSATNNPSIDRNIRPIAIITPIIPKQNVA